MIKPASDAGGAASLPRLAVEVLRDEEAFDRIEGEWDEVFAVVRKCYERMKKDCNRISCSIKVDYRKGHSGRLVSKVASVEKTLKRSIRQ